MNPPTLSPSSLGLQAENGTGSLYIGGVPMSILPAKELHDFVIARNNYVAYTVLPKIDKMTMKCFGDDAYSMVNVYLGKTKKKPETKDKLGDLDSKQYSHPLFYSTAQKYKLDTRYVESVFVTPTLDQYVQHFRNQNKDPFYTLDLAGWKNWVLSNRYICTEFFYSTTTDGYLSFDAFQRHAYIVGGTGSGKSELIKKIIHRQIVLLAQGGRRSSAVVIDPHGDLVEEIASFKECEGNKDIIVFDPTLYKDKIPSISLFTPPDYEDESIDTMAQNLTNAFSEVMNDTSISAQMKTLLIPCVSVLLRRKNSDIGDLQRFMLSEENSDLVELGKQSKNKGHSDFFKKGFHGKNFEVTKKSIYTRLQALRNSTYFRIMLSAKATFDLEKELNSGKIVLFNLSKTTLGEDVSSAYGRLIVALVKSMGFRRQNISKEKRIPTYVYIDECQNYVGESIETTLTELRKYGIHLILANQVLGQNMSTQLVDIILSNTSVKFIGKNGSKTLKRMSVETGAPYEELEKLTVGHFYCKINSATTITIPFKHKVSADLIGKKHSMSASAWQKTLATSWSCYIKNSIAEQEEEKINVGVKNVPDFIPDPEEKDTAPLPSSTKNKPKFEL